MLSVILPRTDEPSVVQLTQENLQRELSTVKGAELLLVDRWEEGVARSKNDFLCFVEPDCLVSSGYFSSNLGLFLKNSYFRKLAMVSSCVGLNNWGNRIYGYEIDGVWSEEENNVRTKNKFIVPAKEKKSNSLFSIQSGFFPGSVIRKSAAGSALKEFKSFQTRNLVQLSTDLSFYFWNTGRYVQVNPNTTYISTAEYLANPPQFKWKLDKAIV